MKRILFLAAVMLNGLTIQAQTIVNDSAEIGSTGQQSVFYNLTTNQKTTVSYNDWHLAISIRATEFPYSPLGGTTMRINEPIGVTAYDVPNAGISQFNTIDTTGYQSWDQLHDSDTAIDEGALNSNRDRSNIFDFGWGVYSSATHNVAGDSVYLIQLPNGDFKKFYVVVLQRDTAFDIKYANLDNSNLQTLHISKKDYIGKQFVYLNMLTNTITDKEPLATAWDLQFLNYEATDVVNGQYMPAMGVWVNKGTEVAKRTNHPVADNDYSNLTFSKHLNSIGWNWKAENGLTKDSLTYFIKTNAGDYYKVIFTGYTANGQINFSTEKLITSAIEETGASTLQINIYPNPTAAQLNVYTPGLPATLRIIDLGGRIINELPATDNLTRLSTDNLENGIYLLQVNHNDTSSVNRFVVNK